MLLFYVSFVVFLLGEVSAANNWVIGYGSLMSTNYFPNGKDKFVPVRISGMTRAWDSPGVFALGQGAGSINLAYQENTIFLGSAESSGTINGVAHLVDPAELAALDVRQLSSGIYTRGQLTIDRVNVLYGEPQFQMDDTLWIYLLNSSYISMKTTPSSTALITQSYLDLVLSACLTIDLKYAAAMGNYSFSQEFMNTTVGWDANYWVNDRVLPRRPWTYQTNVAQLDTILLNYLGATTLDKIQIDDPSRNSSDLTAIRADILALQVDDKASKAELTHVHEELDWQAGNFSVFKISTTAELTHVHAELDWQAGNFSEYKANTTAELTHVHEEIDAHFAEYAEFKASTLAEFTNVKSAQTQMRADMNAMAKEMEKINERLRVMEEDYKGLLITWIVSIIVFALILIGIIFFLWRKNQQQTESIESIPLRPARGYSYT